MVSELPIKFAIEGRAYARGMVHGREISSALGRLSGKVQYAKFMGREMDLQSCLLAARHAISEPEQSEELTRLLGATSAFRQKDGVIAGDLDRVVVAGQYLPRATKVENIQRAEIIFWIVDGELTRYAIDLSAVNDSPRSGQPPHIRSQWTVVFGTHRVAPVTVPADAIDKLGP